MVGSLFGLVYTLEPVAQFLLETNIEYRVVSHSFFSMIHTIYYYQDIHYVNILYANLYYLPKNKIQSAK